MQYRDALISSLTLIARRMRLRAALRELTWAACALASTLLVYQILAALIPAPAVASALKALLVLLFIGSIGFFAVRGARRITLAQAAAATDACADLKDELKTAYWFARQGEALPLIDLQIRRAVLALHKLHPNKLFTIAITRRAFAALGLALIAGWLAWFSPRLEYHPSSHAPIVAMEPVKAPVAGRGASVQDKQEHTANAAAWAKLESTIHSLGQGQERAVLAAAIESRDSARAAQLLEEISRKREYARAPTAARNAAGSATAPASADLLARLKDIFSRGGGDASQPVIDGGADDQLARALGLAQKLSEDTKAPANNPANHTADEATNNPLQAAVPLERYGPRETRRSETQGGEFAGTTDVEGGAMGRRVTQTTLGAGGKPSANDSSANNDMEAESVLGKRTMRLAAKLERLNIDSNRRGDADAQGVTDSVYAATRAQQAQQAYENAPQQTRYVSESGVSGERIPLAYRGAVKEYFLNLNRKEP